MWGGIWRGGKIPLYFYDGTLKSRDYIEVLRDTYLGYLRRVHGEGTALTLVQDHAKCHMSNDTKAWLHRLGIQWLDTWPPRSPNINPIENLWGYLDARVAERRPSDKIELRNIVESEWEKISLPLLQNLIDSVPNRIHMVAEANGGFIQSKY